MDWGRQIMQLWRVGVCVGAALVSLGLLGDIVQAGPVVSTRKE
jgi:hypothetical protein